MKNRPWDWKRGLHIKAVCLESFLLLNYISKNGALPERLLCPSVDSLFLSVSGSGHSKKSFCNVRNGNYDLFVFNLKKK